MKYRCFVLAKAKKGGTNEIILAVIQSVSPVDACIMVPILVGAYKKIARDSGIDIFSGHSIFLYHLQLACQNLA